MVYDNELINESILRTVCERLTMFSFIALPNSSIDGSAADPFIFTLLLSIKFGSDGFGC